MTVHKSMVILLLIIYILLELVSINVPNVLSETTC